MRKLNIKRLWISFILTASMLPFQNCGNIADRSTAGVLENDQKAVDDLAAKLTEKFLLDQGFSKNDDMFVPPSNDLSQSMRSMKTQQASGANLWPDATIPVRFASNITDSQKSIFWQAAQEWHQGVGVRFVEYTNQSHFYLVKNGGQGTGCNSTIGFFVNKYSSPNMNLEDICWEKGLIMHELGHAMGLQHEHQRPDRDNFIVIREDKKNYEWLQKVNTPTTSPYDPTSTMHYCFSPQENYFDIKEGAVFDPRINLNDICTYINNYKLSYFDRKATEDIFYQSVVYSVNITQEPQSEVVGAPGSSVFLDVSYNERPGIDYKVDWYKQGSNTPIGSGKSISVVVSSVNETYYARIQARDRDLVAKATKESARAVVKPGSVNPAPQPPPSNTVAVCPATDAGISNALDCRCENTGSGNVWGSGTFTGDSSICRAAAHAGIAIGQTVKVRLTSGCSTYTGTSRNGVETLSYGSWPRAFYFEGVSSASCVQGYANSQPPPSNQQATCVFNGQSVAHNQSVTAFQSSSVPQGSSCVQQIRTCNNGSLSGSYTFSSCSVQSAPPPPPSTSCPVTESASCGAYGQAMWNGNCDKGTYSGWMVKGGQWVTCSNSTPPADQQQAACVFNGQSVAHNQSVIAYQSSSVPNGSACVQQTRTCNNGSLSGSYTFSSCAVQASPPPPPSTSCPVTESASCGDYGQAMWGDTCSKGVFEGWMVKGGQWVTCNSTPPADQQQASCLLNGQSVAHNQSVIAYQYATVPYGSSCVQETRICNSGSLSGSYPHSICDVEPPPATARVSITKNPQNVTVKKGEKAEFKVKYLKEPGLTYSVQWYVLAPGSSIGELIPGSTKNSHTVKAKANGYRFYAIVTAKNSSGAVASVNSTSGILTVK